MKLSVIVTTYKRPKELHRCLTSINGQSMLPDETIVVCRDEDVLTIGQLEHWKEGRAGYEKKVVRVSQPGVTHALAKGVAQAKGDVVAFTDDDAAPQKDWLQSIYHYYLDNSIGAVGGQDEIGGVPVHHRAERIGHITFYGKLIGNHQLGCREVTEVDVLKGVNLSARRELVKFPDFLKGEGAQVHWEIYLCLYIKQCRYRLIYDPEVKVSHYPAQRFDSDQRGEVVFKAVRDKSYNLNMVMFRFFPLYRIMLRVAYAALIGDKACPGALRLILGFLKSESDVINSFIPAQLGLYKAIATIVRIGRRILSD